MNIKQATNTFVQTTISTIIRHYGHADKGTISMEWFQYIDSLHRDGMITDRQAHRWCFDLDKHPIKKFIL